MTDDPTPGLTAIVGTLNLDLVVRVDRRPAVGETVLGRGYSERPGGKGANQAAAAASVGSAALVGAVGEDDAGRLMVAAQERAGVDTRFVSTRGEVSGRAVIEVDADGDNAIVVVSGANHLMTADDVTSALDALQPVAVLTQLESPRDVTGATADWCRHRDRRFVLNPSPVADLEVEILALADPLVVNEGEGSYYRPTEQGHDGGAVEDLAADLLAVARSVVVTLGPRGVIVANSSGVHHIPVSEVKAVDTTGAGDLFVGTLVAQLSGGAELVDASTRSARIATELVARER